MFKHWFFGSEAIVHSDCNPLTYFTESAPKSSKLVRGSLALAELNLENAGKLTHFLARGQER